MSDMLRFRPTPQVARAGIALLLILALAVPFPARSQRRLPAADPAHSRIKFPDSLTSLNNRCMVRKAKLNPKVRPVYVNHQPVGFC